MNSFAVYGQSEVRSAGQQQHEDDYISQKSSGRTQRLKVMECKVKLLDGTDYTCTVEVRDDEGQLNTDKQIIILYRKLWFFFFFLS